MYSLTTVILVGAIVAVVGFVAGLIVSRSSQSQQASRDLENRLQKAEDGLKSYQYEVTQHFAQTSQLVGNLTQSYKDVHEHLANSALKLTTADVSKQFVESANSQLPQEEHIQLDETHIEPPKDWAPKTPGSASTLSEEYGLDSGEYGADGNEDTAATATPQAANISDNSKAS